MPYDLPAAPASVFWLEFIGGDGLTILVVLSIATTIGGLFFLRKSAVPSAIGGLSSLALIMILASAGTYRDAAQCYGVHESILASTDRDEIARLIVKHAERRCDDHKLSAVLAAHPKSKDFALHLYQSDRKG